MFTRFSLLLLLTFWPVPSSFRDWFKSYKEEMANKAYSQHLRGFKHLFVKQTPFTPQETRIPDITSTIGPFTPFQNSTFPSEADNESLQISHNSSNPWLFILLSSLSAVLLTTGVALGLRNRFLTTAIHTDSIES